MHTHIEVAWSHHTLNYIKDYNYRLRNLLHYNTYVALISFLSSLGVYYLWFGQVDLLLVFGCGR